MVYGQTAAVRKRAVSLFAPVVANDPVDASRIKASRRSTVYALTFFFARTAHGTFSDAQHIPMGLTMRLPRCCR
jgi:hypothetical protein